MAGYSKTPLWQKLGLKPGIVSLVEGEPRNYQNLLELREVMITWTKRPRAGLGFVHYFARTKIELAQRLALFRRLIVSDGIIWISWPKQTAKVAT